MKSTEICRLWEENLSFSFFQYLKVTYDVYLLHMVALYWFEAVVVNKLGNEGTFAALVQADPVRGYLAILTVTCLGGYAAGVVHNKMHSLVNKAPGKKKQANLKA